MLFKKANLVNYNSQELLNSMLMGKTLLKDLLWKPAPGSQPCSSWQESEVEPQKHLQSPVQEAQGAVCHCLPQAPPGSVSLREGPPVLPECPQIREGRRNAPAGSFLRDPLSGATESGSGRVWIRELEGPADAVCSGLGLPSLLNSSYNLDSVSVCKCGPLIFTLHCPLVSESK